MEPAPKEEDCLLCVAPIIIQMPINKSWSYSDTQDCHNSDSVLECKYRVPIHKSKHLNTVDINFANKINEPKFESSIIQTKDLLQHNTRVEFQLSLFTGLQHSLMQILGTQEPLTRMVLVLYEKETAAWLYQLVFDYNKSLGHKEIEESLLTCGMKQITMFEDLEELIDKKIVSNKIITGFFLDCGLKFLMYLEGLASGFLQVNNKSISTKYSD